MWCLCTTPGMNVLSQLQKKATAVPVLYQTKSSGSGGIVLSLVEYISRCVIEALEFRFVDIIAKGCKSCSFKNAQLVFKKSGGCPYRRRIIMALVKKGPRPIF